MIFDYMQPQRRAVPMPPPAIGAMFPALKMSYPVGNRIDGLNMQGAAMQTAALIT